MSVKSLRYFVFHPCPDSMALLALVPLEQVCCSLCSSRHGRDRVVLRLEDRKEGHVKLGRASTVQWEGRCLLDLMVSRSAPVVHVGYVAAQLK